MARSTDTSSDSDDEDARRFRMQCASVASNTMSDGVNTTTATRERHTVKMTTTTTTTKMVGSDRIARILEDKVDKTLVFTPPTQHRAGEEGDGGHDDGGGVSGMQLFRRGPCIAAAAAAAAAAGPTSVQSNQHDDTGQGRRHSSLLPARRMIDHEALFSGTASGIDEGVVVQGDVLIEHLKHLSATYPTCQGGNDTHCGIVVETIRSKARLRRIKNQCRT